MELPLCMLRPVEILTLVGRRTLGTRRAARLELALGVTSLRHNDNIIQIKSIDAKSSIYYDLT